MYKWYRNSAFTLVLPDKSPIKPDSRELKDNRWMFCVWTLQEVLAPRVIRFYERDWKLYFDNSSDNHKTSQKISRELAEATGVEEGAPVDFLPETLTVRQRLRLASTRGATVKVDVAYSLIGIFSSDIHVECTREADVALGHLLQEIVNRQGDITVLDWIGVPSKFNSCLPADVSVYRGSPYSLPDIARNAVQPSLPEQEVVGFYNLLSTLGLPRFADRRLSLPCITFSVAVMTSTPSSASDQGIPVYLASTTTLGIEVGFRSKDTSLLTRRMVFVYPWIRDLLARFRHHGGDKSARAARLIRHPERGFKALLFAERSDQQYRRVATDQEIIVPPRKLTSSEDVGIEVLEIWERS